MSKKLLKSLIAVPLFGVGLSFLLLIAALITLHIQPIRHKLLAIGLARLPALVGATVTVESTSLNLAAGKVALHGLRISPVVQQDQQQVIEIADLSIDVEMTALLFGKVSIESISIVSPLVVLTATESGEILTPLSPVEEPAAESTPEPQPPAAAEQVVLPDVTVKHLNLSNATFRLDSHSKTIPSVSVQGINLTASLDLAKLISTGKLSVELLEVKNPESLVSPEPLAVNWELPGNGKGTVALAIAVAGLKLGLNAELKNLLPDPLDLVYDATVDVSGDLPLQLVLPELAAAGSIQLKAKAIGGIAAIPAVDLNLTGSDLRYNGWHAPILSLDAQLNDQQFTIERLNLETAGGLLVAQGRGNLKPELSNLELQLTITELDLTQALAPLTLPVKITGLSNAEVTAKAVRPELAGLTATVALTLDNQGLAATDVLAPTLNLAATIADSMLKISHLELAETSTSAKLTGSYHFTTQDYSCDLNLQAPNLGDLLARLGFEGQGVVTAEVSGKGNIRNPMATGRIRAQHLKIEGTELGVANLDVALLEGLATVKAETIEVLGFGASLFGEARIPFSAGAEPIHLDVTLRETTYHTTLLDTFNVQASIGDLITASLTTASQTLSAQVRIPKVGALLAEAQLDNFDLGVARAFLPESAPSLSGTISAGVTAVVPQNQGFPEIIGTVSNLLIQAENRTLRIAEPLNLTLNQNQLAIDSLNLVADESSLLALTGNVDLTAETLDATIRCSVPQLSAWQKLAGEIPLQGALDLDMKVQGPFTLPQPVGRLTVSNLQVADLAVSHIKADFQQVEQTQGIQAIIWVSPITWQTKTFPEVSLNAGILTNTVTVATSLFEQSLLLNASFDLAGAQDFSAVLQLAKFQLDTIASFVELPFSLVGSLSGEINASGQLTDLEGVRIAAELPECSVNLNNVGLGAPQPLQCSLEHGVLSLTSFILKGDGLDLTLSGELPIDLTSPAGAAATNPDEEVTLTETRPSNSTLARNQEVSGLGVEARIQLPILLTQVEALDRAEGTTTVKLMVTGALTAPRLAGEIRVLDAAFDGPGFPSAFDKVSALVLLTPSALVLDSLKAAFARGTIEGSGQVALQDLTPSDINLQVRARDLDLSLENEIDLKTSANVRIIGTYPKVKAAGEITVHEALYAPTVDFLGILKALTDRSSPMAEGGELDDSDALELQLDLAVNAAQTVTVDNPNLQLTLGAKLQLIGTATLPGVLGTVTIVDGVIDLFRAQFTITQGLVSFIDPWAMNPKLDITAIAEKKGEEITLRIQGEAANPHLNLTSTSGKSQTEIIKLLVGVPPDPGESGMSLGDMAKGYARNSLAGALADQVGVRTGLEIVPFPSSSEGEDFIFSAKKELGDSASVTYLKGLKPGEGDAVEVEYELDSTTRLRARQNQDGSVSGGVRWRFSFN